MINPEEEKTNTLPGGWKADLLLFWSFFKIVTVVVGGGYAIIAAAQQEFVSRRKWLTEEDFAEMMTVILTVPGLLAINASVYLGWKMHRFPGAVAALIGALLPSVSLIILIAAGISQITGFLYNPYVQGAFRGVLCGVIALIGVSAVKLFKSGIHSGFDWVVAIGCFGAVALIKINPAFVVLVAIAAGLLKQACCRKGAKK